METNLFVSIRSSDQPKKYLFLNKNATKSKVRKFRFQNIDYRTVQTQKPKKILQYKGF